MLDILQLRVNLDELEQLHICQITQRSDGYAAFSVKSTELIWPMASWGDVPVEERINVRGWFPLLDQIADEFLIWWPRGGCFFVSRDGATYRAREHGPHGVLFMQFEVNRLQAVPRRQANARRTYLV
jgi:hypothetical protein